MRFEPSAWKHTLSGTQGTYSHRPGWPLGHSNPVWPAGVEPALQQQTQSPPKETAPGARRPRFPLPPPTSQGPRRTGAAAGRQGGGKCLQAASQK